MSIDQAKSEITAVLTALIAAHTSYTLLVERDNRKTVNQATQVNPYLKMEIKFLNGEQADMSSAPRVQVWGQVWLTAVCKCGIGTEAVDELRDFVTSYYTMKDLGLVKMQAAFPALAKEVKGLWESPVIIPFYYHTISA